MNKICVICEGILEPRQHKYCLDCKKYIGKQRNLNYKGKICTICGKRLTARDMFRKNRLFYRPGIEDCERCEKGQKIVKLSNSLTSKL